MKTIAYLRVSTGHQDVKNQKYEILAFAQANKITVDHFIEVEVSSQKSTAERKIDELMNDLTSGDYLIVSELSRLGRSTHEVIGTVNRLIEKSIKLTCIRQNLTVNGKNDLQTKITLTMFSLFAELERDLISERTKTALAAKKASGVKLGRKVGSLSKSKLDDKIQYLSELHTKRVSISSIAKIMEVSRGTVYNFIKTRNIR